MKRKIAIIGAGQGGLQLGFSLLKDGYKPVIYTDRTPAEVLNSPPPPIPIQFYPSVQFEKELGISFWENEKPCRIDGVRFDMYGPERQYIFTIKGPLKVKAQTVDLRLKYATWMQEFTRRGGVIKYENANVDLLERLASDNDLVVVSTGKTEVSDLFEKDAAKNTFDKPQRNLALFYAKGCKLNYSDEADSGGSSYNIMQGAGELIMSPFLSKDSERIFYILVEALPGGPLDIFDRKNKASAELEKCKTFFKENYPPLYEMIKDAKMVKEDEWICGSILPTVRKPVGYLPSGRYVMGLGDVIILNDPIMAQGLNGVSKMADFMSRAITNHNGSPFSDNWMNKVFNEYWETAQYNTKLTNTLLGVPQPHQVELLFAASQNPNIAEDFINGIGKAYSMYPWFGDANEAKMYLERKAKSN